MAKINYNKIKRKRIKLKNLDQTKIQQRGLKSNIRLEGSKLPCSTF